ncbi:hypothetical protein IAR50_005750 [Cryptococcus sp. DSM 104548]
MADLDNLFNSPPHSPPPPPRARSTTPDTPVRDRSVGEALFFSPGASQFGSPSASQQRQPVQQNREREERRRIEMRREEGGGIVRVRHAVNVVDPVDPLPRDSGNYSAAAFGAGAGGGSGEGMYGAITDPLAAGTGGDDDGDGETGEKRRRPMAKVDADRLLSDSTGIPALMRSAKKFKTHGKGREKDDLRALLHMYQMWAHGMFPKGSFAQTMDRTEKVCRTRRMESAIGGLSDAFHGRRSPPPSPPAPARSPVADRSDASPSRQSGAPESSARGALFAAAPAESAGDEWEGVDMDELMEMQAQEAYAAQAEKDEFGGLYD